MGLYARLLKVAVAAVVLPQAAWVSTWAPGPAAPGAVVRVEARARNTGKGVWEPAGRDGVHLTLLVVDGNGNPWSEQPAPVGASYATPPGGSTTFAASVTAPSIPGRYTVLVGLERAGGRAMDIRPTRIPLEVTAKNSGTRTITGPGAGSR